MNATTQAPERHSVPGRAGRLLDELADRAVLHDVYDEVGAPIYHDLSGQDRHEVRELASVVRRLPGPVLDLAAGSGRLTLPLLALGREVTALELSESMLRLLATRLDEAPERLRRRCTLAHADMSGFALGTRFGAIVLGTTSVSLLDQAGRAGLFASVREHLAPGGRFLLSTVDSLPAGSGLPDDPEAEFEVTGSSGRLYRMFEYWPPEADARTITVFPEAAGDGPVEVCTTTVRVLRADRLETELADAGLTVRTRHALPDAAWRHRAVLLEAEVA
ncbi:class I SAM-dependent methyltransferase [Streptomyces sp. KM77-8]|uniref:Class I SAM-dependent methyltransferase n=1 Tax=Streptomyces haneummycinicus TaxID=3074435 RepID=A0AAT9HWN4_9ACTN